LFAYLNFSKRTIQTLAFTAFVLLGLVACGQKGSLYLPNIPSAPNVMANENHFDTDISEKTDKRESDEQEKDKNKVTAESSESLPAHEAEK
jgi:predicted small lipoprotein YifL